MANGFQTVLDRWRQLAADTPWPFGPREGTPAPEPEPEVEVVEEDVEVVELPRLEDALTWLKADLVAYAEANGVFAEGTKAEIADRLVEAGLLS